MPDAVAPFSIVVVWRGRTDDDRFGQMLRDCIEPLPSRGLNSSEQMELVADDRGIPTDLERLHPELRMGDGFNLHPQQSRLLVPIRMCHRRSDNKRMRVARSTDTQQRGDRLATAGSVVQASSREPRDLQLSHPLAKEQVLMREQVLPERSLSSRKEVVRDRRVERYLGHGRSSG